MSSIDTSREWVVGLVRASKYLTLSGLLLNLSLLWVLICLLSSLMGILTAQNTFEELQRRVATLMLNPQLQVAVLGVVIGFLVSLYAIFAELIPSLKELEGYVESLRTSLALISIGLILTITLLTVPITLSPLLYFTSTNPTLYFILSALPLGSLITYFVSYLGFLLTYVKLGALTGRSGFTVVGVLLLLSTFIIPVGFIAWLISFITARDLVKSLL